MSRCAKLSYALMCLGLVVLGATGIGVFTFGKPPMTHWVLIVHMMAAPVFALGIAAVALTWADMCRHGASPHLGALAKFLFWVILVCGFVVIFTGVVPMLPFYGTDGQHTLYLTHRYAGITLAAAVLLHLPALRSSPNHNPTPNPNPVPRRD